MSLAHKLGSGCYPSNMGHMSGEDVMSPVSLLSSLPQKPWFTVLSLGQIIRPEQVKVQLNPPSRILLIKAYPRTFSKLQQQPQKIQHLLTLPKNIRLDKLQVQLTPRGELVVIAPFKFTQKGESGNKWFGAGEEDSLSNLMSTFYQQQLQGSSPLMQWIPIPIHITRSLTSNPSSRYSHGPYQSGSETDTTTTSSSGTSTEEDTTSCSSSSSSSSSSSESESECESGWEGMNLPQHFSTLWTTGTSSTPINKEQVQKYLRFVKKIFYPNMVEGQVVPMESSSSTTSTPSTPKKWQLVLTIKFVDFRPENDQVNVYQHESKRNVLIVEGKRKLRQVSSSTTSSTSSSAVHYVRREIFVPEWLNVQKMMFRGVQENGVLRIVLPIRSNTDTGLFNKRTTGRSGMSHSYSPMSLNNILISQQSGKSQQRQQQQQKLKLKKKSQSSSRRQYSS
jgi:virulence-associated protein VagC